MNVIWMLWLYFSSSSLYINLVAYLNMLLLFCILNKIRKSYIIQSIIYDMEPIIQNRCIIRKAYHCFRIRWRIENATPLSVIWMCDNLLFQSTILWHSEAWPRQHSRVALHSINYCNYFKKMLCNYVVKYSDN